MKTSKMLALVMSLVVVVSILCGCAGIESGVMSLKGDLLGTGYTIDTFDNFGNLTLKTRGDRINLDANYTYDFFNETREMAAPININIDSEQIVSCGDTAIFYEDGLEPIYNFNVSRIESNSDEWSDATLFTGMVNHIKNLIGKPVVVVIKSQTGYPIYAFEGEEVYWEIPDDLPKSTCLNIDGKRVYIHRANFQIINEALINE